MVATRAAAPPLATAPTWRPPEQLSGLHLEAFGVLPPPDADAPQPGTAWPFCIKEINWPLFPGGPPTLDSYAYPASFRGCDAADIPSSRVVDRRKGHVRIATGGGGPSRQGIIEVWQQQDRLFTPCMLESGGARLWTHSRTAGPVEAVDDSRVAIIGTSDVCGQEKLTETVVVPKGLRPATRRKWKLVCMEPADRGDCAPRQQELQPHAEPRHRAGYPGW